MEEIKKLLSTMAQLRDPDIGCSWIQRQTWESLIPYTFEESYEVEAAIQEASPQAVKEELGDLLFQIVFYSQIAQEKNYFTFADVVQTVNEKLIRRHPHVFETPQQISPEAISVQWQITKAVERQEHYSDSSLLANIPINFPAIMRAEKLQKRCSTVGFDWPNAQTALDKVREETEEVAMAFVAKNKENIQEELGDLLFAVINVCRLSHIDTEQCLKQANQKFETRFRAVEHHAEQEQLTLSLLSEQQLNTIWNLIKDREKL